MLNNTRNTLKDIVSDLKRFSFGCGVVSNALPIIYLIYAICAPAGIAWVNVALLVPSCVYFTFYLITHGNTDKGVKQTRRMTKHALAWYKIVIKLFNMIVVLNSIYAASTHVTVWSIVLAAFTVISLIFQMILELVVLYVEAQCDKIYHSFLTDMDVIIKPVQQVKGLIGKITGGEDSGNGDNGGETPRRGIFDIFARR